MCRNQDLEMEVSQLKVEVETLYQSCLEFEEYKKRLDSNARLVYLTCAHVRVYVCVHVYVCQCVKFLPFGLSSTYHWLSYV